MSENKNLVRSYLEALSTEGMAALERYGAQDVRWWALGVGEVSMERLKGFGDFIGAQLAGPMQFTLHELIAEGNQVAAEVESYIPLQNGKVYNNRYHFKFIIEDGKIAEIREYGDTRHAAEIFGDLLGG
ncbi:MAG TPA: nuclear transport factor 2 family protein [Steroidobacteraceae bacterium]|nr:nuclear transport factor 2 family protein [Steroidobacteraceae bacterium]